MALTPDDFSSTMVRWLQFPELAPANCVSGRTLDAGCATQALDPSRFDRGTKRIDWSGLTFDFTNVTTPVSLSVGKNNLDCYRTTWLGEVTFIDSDLSQSEFYEAHFKSPFHLTESKANGIRWCKTITSESGRISFFNVEAYGAYFEGLQSLGATTDDALLSLKYVRDFSEQGLAFTGKFDGKTELRDVTSMGEISFARAHMEQLRLGSLRVSGIRIEDSQITRLYTNDLNNGGVENNFDISIVRSNVGCEGDIPAQVTEDFPGFAVSWTMDSWNMRDSQMSGCWNLLDNPKVITIGGSEVTDTNFEFEFYDYTGGVTGSHHVQQPLTLASFASSHFTINNRKSEDTHPHDRRNQLFNHLYVSQLQISDVTFTCNDDLLNPTPEGCHTAMLYDVATSRAFVSNVELRNAGINKWNPLSSMADEFPDYVDGKERLTFNNVLLTGDEVTITGSEIFCNSESDACIPPGIMVAPETEVEISDCDAVINRMIDNAAELDSNETEPDSVEHPSNRSSHLARFGLFNAAVGSIGTMTSNMNQGLLNGTQYPLCNATIYHTDSESLADDIALYIGVALMGCLALGTAIFLLMKMRQECHEDRNARLDEDLEQARIHHAANDYGTGHNDSAHGVQVASDTERHSPQHADFYEAEPALAFSPSPNRRYE